MALGSTYNNNRDANKPFSPTVYSGYSMKNPDSKVDATALGFSFWKNTLKVSISPKKLNGSADYVQFDRDNGIAVNLTHTKASMLAHEIKLFLSDPDKYTGSGVTSGADGIITISNGREIGSTNPCLIIRKVDENGAVVSSFAYEFKTDYHYSLRNYTGTPDLTKCTDDYANIEVEQVITLLEEYTKAMTNAIAFTCAEQIQYPINRMDGKINDIMSKLGIERTTSGGSRQNYSSNSFFNRQQSGSAESASSVDFNSGSIDDLDPQYN